MLLVCDVCRADAAHTAWGHYKIDVETRTVVPDLSICRDCYNGLSFGIQPDPPPDYTQYSGRVHSDAAVRLKIRSWSAMQQGGSPNFVPQSVVTSERVEMIWEERFDIQKVSEFSGDAHSLAELQTTDMKDPHGNMHKVILTEGEQKPVALFRRIVTHDRSDHHLRPETMVCIEQASRVQEAVKVPFQNPKAAMTTEQYRRSAAQRQPQQEGRTASGTSEDGRPMAGSLGRLFGSPLLAERHDGETSAVVANTSPAVQQRRCSDAAFLSAYAQQSRLSAAAVGVPGTGECPNTPFQEKSTGKPYWCHCCAAGPSASSGEKTRKERRRNADD